MAIHLPVVIVMTQTYIVKQFCFAIERDNGDTIAVKVFSAPYGLWWVGDENQEISLSKEEIDAIHVQLRNLQRVRKNLNDQRNDRYNAPAASKADEEFAGA